MSRSKKDILDTEKMLERLATLLAATHKGRMPDGASRRDAEALRRISMTLHNWHELECGTDRGHIERDEKTGKPYHVSAEYYSHPVAAPSRRMIRVLDREAGALKRLKAIMARYPALQAYVQTDPRGCALYILKPGDVPDGADVSAYYSRGLAVYR